MKATALVLIFFLFLGGAFLEALTPREAAKHIGDSATVTGVVAEVAYYKSKGDVAMYFDHAHPKQTFVAYVPSATVNFIGLKVLRGYKDKVVSVNGTLRVWQGKPQIEVTNASQIVEVKEK